MVRKAVSVIRKASTRGYTLVITIPSKLALDSTFPFKEDDPVVIEIDAQNKALVIKHTTE